MDCEADLCGDVSNCADVGGLKRFEGSSIVLCGSYEFAEYTLPTGRASATTAERGKDSFEAVMSLERPPDSERLCVPMGPSAAQVFRNYKTDLAAKGYSILFEAKQADIGPAMGEFFEDTGPGTQIWGYSPDEARYARRLKTTAALRRTSRFTSLSTTTDTNPASIRRRAKSWFGSTPCRLAS